MPLMSPAIFRYHVSCPLPCNLLHLPCTMPFAPAPLHLALGGHCFGQECLPCAWGPIQQDPLPGLSDPCEHLPGHGAGPSATMSCTMLCPLHCPLCFVPVLCGAVLYPAEPSRSPLPCPRAILCPRPYPHWQHTSGISIGSTTASLSSRLASSSLAIWSQARLPSVSMISLSMSSIR